MEDRLMYVPNDDKQNNFFYRLKLFVENFSTDSLNKATKL